MRGHALRDIQSIITRTDEGDTAYDWGLEEGQHRKVPGTRRLLLS